MNRCIQCGDARLQEADALLGALVVDELEGRTKTVERLRALREPAEAPAQPVRLSPVAA